MAAVATQVSPHGSPVMSEQSIKGLKKVLSNRRRSSEAQSDRDVAPSDRQDSVDSLSLDKSPTRHSTHSSPSRDGSSKSGSSGLRTLLPGHSKRKRRKAREEELRQLVEEGEIRGRVLSADSASGLQPPLSRKASSNLLTDDSDVESPQAPPLISRDSHTGYLTTSSPLITTSSTTAVPDQNDAAFENNGTLPTNRIPSQSVPTLVEPTEPESSPSPKSTAVESTPNLPMPGLLDKADTLKPDSRRNSITKIRSKSPVRKFRDVFRPNKSPHTSPERSGFSSPLGRSSTVAVDVPDEAPVLTSPDSTPARATTFPPIDTATGRPETPPSSIIAAPVTTVTPPTPTDTRFDLSEAKPSDKDDPSTRNNPNIVVSPSGNMISHRRIRSAGSVSHQPSKLSNSMTAPLTPTIEESKTAATGSTAANRTPSGGSFFSSWVSAAQNAANSITNLGQQTRSRTSTNASDPASQKTITDTIKEEPEIEEPESPPKKLAIETLGSGELNLDSLVTEGDAFGGPVKPSLTEFRHDSVVERDLSAAKAEDALAKRAVSAAYEKLTDTTPVAEISDPMNNAMRHAQTISGAMPGDHTPPNGSIIDGEATSVKRTNSVRSKLANRRSRGSSAATGQSAIGALMSSSTMTLADPAKGPKLSGFSMAPKQRNRTFHQQFRSVPEDDYLVEDYSCALQKEILLAGRIYISEGHICFSSNILGWVTTLVISFEEVVNLERENTALVIPNAIAIQTLHARHVFRSFLSREATYELLIGIWKVSHPANFQKSLVGKQLVAEEATKGATGTGASDKGSEKQSEGSSGDSDDSDDDDSAPSFVGSAVSMAASDIGEAKALSRKPSGMNGVTAAIAPGGAELSSALASSNSPDAAQDFPGPATHAPSECTDGSTHYDIIIKDEVLPAPLGKIYSLLYGPQSGAFMRKFLVDECKSIDLQLEDDKKGLSNEKKSRQYTYIKPLGGSIGPKQTKCVTTEDLDFFDLEKAVTVTCSTQTPDVPSGSAFVTKTRYCLTWAAGNQTRFQMNCTIEWSAKSWLKGPIEKGAKDGQQQYGDSVVKVLKAAVGSRARGMTGNSKVSKKKKGKKGKREVMETQVEDEVKVKEDWGLLEPLRGPLGPFVNMAKPFVGLKLVVGVLSVMVLWMWFQPRGVAVGRYGVLDSKARGVAYEEMWRVEESELWDWLERRSGVDNVMLRGHNVHSTSDSKSRAKAERKEDEREMKRLQRERQMVLKGKEVEERAREERMGDVEMEEALRVTRERLEVLEGVVGRKKGAKADPPGYAEADA
jgi:hypothetical protein